MRRNRRFANCARCGKSIERAASNLRSENNFCSADCYHFSGRIAARDAGKTRYFTGKPCHNGHVAERLVSNGRCAECLKAASKYFAQTPAGKAAKARLAKKYGQTPNGRVKNAARTKAWNENNRERIAESWRRRSTQFKEQHGVSWKALYDRERLKIDPEYKLGHYLRTYFNQVLTGQAKYTSVLKLLRCSLPELRVHIESQFKPGMSWTNRGHGKDRWQVDHKWPVKAADLNNPEHVRRLWHYTNLQPLWSVENLRKRHAEVYL